MERTIIPIDNLAVSPLLGRCNPFSTILTFVFFFSLVYACLAFLLNFLFFLSFFLSVFFFSLVSLLFVLISGRKSSRSEDSAKDLQVKFDFIINSFFFFFFFRELRALFYMTADGRYPVRHTKSVLSVAI